MSKTKKTSKLFIIIILILWIIASIEAFTILKKYEINISIKKKPSNIPEAITEADKRGKPNKKASIFFTEFLTNLYSEYYDVITVKAYDYLPESQHKLNNTDRLFFVVLEKKLKFKSINDFPFVLGMQECVNEYSQKNPYYAVYKKKKEDLAKFIDLSQFENNIFKISFSDEQSYANLDFSSAKITIATYKEDMPVNTLLPYSKNKLKKNGYQFIKSISKNIYKIDYNNIEAINYADRYSSNPITAEYDDTFWNRQYSTYENDCANFVSQCIHAGGLKTTELWQPDSLMWIRTGSPRYESKGLTDYMQNTHNFFPTSHSAISAGGFICLIKESHVVMVTSNDSITILYNGHTNDRKRISFPHLEKNEAIYLTPNNLP